MKTIQLIFFAIFLCLLSGCFFTKAVTVPLRVSGAVISVVPFVGNTIHADVDEVANSIDDLPF